MEVGLRLLEGYPNCQVQEGRRGRLGADRVTWGVGLAKGWVDC